MDFITFAIVVLCGVAVGVLSGMFGVGGGTVMIPLLRLGFGLPVLGATATSLFTIVPTSVAGFTKHVRQKTANLKQGALIGLSGAVLSPLGAYLSSIASEIVVMSVTAVVIIYSALKMFRDPITTQVVGQVDMDVDGAPQPSQTGTFGKRVVFISMGIGLFAGLVAGFVGVGGGFLIVPLAVYLLGFSMKEAVGTSLVSIAIIAIPGAISHALMGHIWYLYGIALMVGSVPGARLGAWIITLLPERTMRRSFGILLAFSGLLLVVNEYMQVAGS